MRGKVGRVYGDLTAMLTILKLPDWATVTSRKTREPSDATLTPLSTSLELYGGHDEGPTLR